MKNLSNWPRSVDDFSCRSIDGRVGETSGRSLINYRARLNNDSDAVTQAGPPFWFLSGEEESERESNDKGRKSPPELSSNY
jgi:hypothetical protein